MNIFKSRLFGALFVLIFSMNFTLIPQKSDIDGVVKGGEWVYLGEELIAGVWYSVNVCIKNDKAECVIGSKKYEKKIIIVQSPM